MDNELDHRSRSASVLQAFAQWVVLGAAVGVLAGLASAAFLYLLGRATAFRESHPVIVYTLPLAGAVIGALYARFGTQILGGNNLVLDTVHEDSPEIPFRMAPMVLLGTVLTHLFGGSAGREGTAVQMGASLADFLSHRLRLDAEMRRELLTAGIAGGFGSVFGTPIAGAVFGLEVVVVGRMGYEALVPALVASVVGDLVTRGVGIVHTVYPSPGALPLTPGLLTRWIVFGVAVALTAVAFVELTHFLKVRAARWIPSLPLRMAVGGALVVGMWLGVGTDDYLGLGIPTILRAFSDPSLPATAFALKLVFTAVTLSAGFLGGEVTPLFFVGAALGNALGRLLGLPLDLAAGVGLAAMFAAASNTPLALSIMAVELMGAHLFPHVVIVSVVAWLFSGHRGIYPSQRIARLKHGGPLMKRLVSLHALEAPKRDPKKEEGPAICRRSAR
ncbi:MAG: chloride channel protein [Myxococcaceae bacterium]|nr:chloride channel protein [Myxococcaceae bacterium]